MSLPIEDLTPTQIVRLLDEYIVGQAAAKRAVAIALRNRFRRQKLPLAEREEVLPKNILMVGPTGVGKTEIARRLAVLARAPFIKVEATKFTEVGYVGRDVESMVRDLVGIAVRLVEREKLEEHREEAENRALERIAELLDENSIPYEWGYHDDPESRARLEEALEEQRQRRERIIAEVREGLHHQRVIEFDTEEPSSPFLQVFTPQGMEEMGLDLPQLGGGPKRVARKVTVEAALAMMTEEEAKKMFDSVSVHREAVERTEQTGIIFIDEIDKVAGKSGGSGPDVSREGVQRDLLPVIEGSTVQSKFGPVRTDHILFIAAGAFHISSPSDLIPELQGRLPIRVELEPLAESDFRKILAEPKNALVRQYEKLLAVDGVQIEFMPRALDKVAAFAFSANSKQENIGARRLHTMMETLLQDILFEAPDHRSGRVEIDEAFVERKLGPAAARSGA